MSNAISPTQAHTYRDFCLGAAKLNRSNAEFFAKVGTFCIDCGAKWTRARKEQSA
jgi:hypothetical protein